MTDEIPNSDAQDTEKIGKSGDRKSGRKSGDTILIKSLDEIWGDYTEEKNVTFS